MKAVVAGALLAACSKPRPPRPATVAFVPRTPLEGNATARDASHLLSRLSFGPRPGEAVTVARDLAGWLETQLVPAKLADRAGEAALAPFADALAPYDQLEDDVMPKRDLVLVTQMTAIARHIASERQVLEVMTDFWTNHFAVSLHKGKVRFLAADFVERVIRPHALGRFSDMLVASARHPAMLLYLDNAQSIAPRAGSKQAKAGRGLNENYARELLELHTLGVDGGYTQQDVVDVARVLTGWSVQDGELIFRSRVHDTGAKTVLGMAFPAGGDEREGVRLLEMLARHPATARNVCRRLCMRLVADVPPPDAIAAAVAAWEASGGEIAATVRAIVQSPAFWTARDSKIKSPLELIASAVRALGGTVEDVGLARVLGRLGHGPLAAPAPTGYADSAAAWLSTAGALERMDVALGLATNKLGGVVVDFDRFAPLPKTQTLPAWRAGILDALDALIPGGLGAHTRATIEISMARLPKPEQARAIAITLAFASPEFQRQ